MTWTMESLRRPAFELMDTTEFYSSVALDERSPDAAVKNWTARGFLHPIMGKRGKKDVRQFTAADLLRIFVVSRLVWQHTSLTAAFGVADRAVSRLETFIQSGKLPLDAAEEHWIVFTDHGEETARYHRNDEANFWILPPFVQDGKVFGPPLPDLQWDTDFEEKIETFNLDRLIKKFLLRFADHPCSNNLLAYRRGGSTEFDRSLLAYFATLTDRPS